MELCGIIGAPQSGSSPMPRYGEQGQPVWTSDGSNAQPAGKWIQTFLFSGCDIVLVSLWNQAMTCHSSWQTLAIYDRFGRLMYGSEQVPKDVLEYVVFERHLPNPYGLWRLHGKIVPAWAPPKDPIIQVLCFGSLALASFLALCSICEGILMQMDENLACLCFYFTSFLSEELPFNPVERH